jgi:membrane protein DedA with SNARE-associated domain
VPFGRFLAVDAAASLLGVPVAFGLAFFFTDQLEQIVRDVHRLERWAVLILLVAVVVYFAARTYRRSRLLDPDTPARRGDAT